MGSPATPTLNGWPELAVKIPLICHPLVAHRNMPGKPFGWGVSHTTLATRLCVRFVSHSPRWVRWSGQYDSATEFRYASEEPELESVSIHLDQVYETRPSTPWVTLC